MTDTKKLVEECLKQDPRAQKTLYDTYAPMMLGVCMRYARSREAAEDTLHDAFVKVFAKLHTLRNKVALEDWIYHIVIYTAINNVKRERWHFEAVEVDAVELDYSPLSEGKAPIGTALPAGTITKSINAIAGIKKIKQSYEGEKGTEDESESLFRCRVSEKLRHKGRAWSAWDYARLLLEGRTLPP